MFRVSIPESVKSLFAGVSVFLVAVAPAFAGRYELVKGQGVEVCEAYEKSLNSFQSKLPMVCGRSVSPEMKDFAKPKWYRPEAYLAPNGVSIYGAYNDFGEFLWERDVNPVRYIMSDQWPKWKGTPAQYKVAKENYLADRSRRWLRSQSPSIAEFDIDNDGTPEPMYLEQACGSVYGTLVAVLTPDYRAIDRKKTELVMPHPPLEHLGLGFFRPVKKGDWGVPPSYVKKGYIPVEDSIGDVYYDVFLYKGKSFVDQWWISHPDFKGKSNIDVGLLRVFMPTRSGTEEICAYRFVSEM